jgi:hypothetical protein
VATAPMKFTSNTSLQQSMTTRQFGHKSYMYIMIVDKECLAGGNSTHEVHLKTHPCRCKHHCICGVVYYYEPKRDMRSPRRETLACLCGLMRVF